MVVSGDWIKLHRKMIRSAVSEDPVVLAVWVHLLLRTNWRRRQLLSGQWLEEGQLIIGQEKFAKRIGVSRKQLRRALDTLERLGNIVRAKKRAKTATHLSICNWRTYQNENGAEGQEKGQGGAKRGPRRGQEGATEEEGTKKEEEHPKKHGRPKPTSGYSDSFERFWNGFSRVRRTKKADAWKAWQQMGCEAIADQVIAASEMYAKSDDGRGEYCSGPGPWLRAARWEDDRASWSKGRVPRAERPKVEDRETRKFEIIRQGREAGASDEEISRVLEKHGLTW